MQVRKVTKSHIPFVAGKQKMKEKKDVGEFSYHIPTQVQVKVLFPAHFQVWTSVEQESRINSTKKTTLCEPLVTQFQLCTGAAEHPQRVE